VSGALEGVRVLDVTSVVMGPLATQVLGDLGADVISIESARDDTNRRMGTGPMPGLSDVSLNLLRNKRNVALDLKDELGRAAALRLAATCDVVVTNLRPGPLGRLGLDYDHVRAVREDVVYARATGFSREDPRRDEAAYDDIIQGATGVPDVFVKASGEAWLAPTLIADKVSGLTLLAGVLAALVHRGRTGEGQLVEVSMFDALSAFLMVEHSSGVASGTEGPAGYRRILSADRRPQASADGYVVIFPYLPGHWEALLRAAGLDELVGDSRLVPSRTPDPAFVYRTLAQVARTRTSAEWVEFCREHQIPATAVPTIEEVAGAWPTATHPRAGEYRVAPMAIGLSKSPASLRRHAPLVGEHNREVLLEAGLSDAEVDELVARGALRSGVAD
jgi:crotonobetainyl-CoA:carnitine CoA-transferase CaiB-like acyl-CoA transferase